MFDHGVEDDWVEAPVVQSVTPLPPFVIPLPLLLAPHLSEPALLATLPPSSSSGRLLAALLIEARSPFPGCRCAAYQPCAGFCAPQDTTELPLQWMDDNLAFINTLGRNLTGVCFT